VLKDLGAVVDEVVFPDLWDYHICGRVIITTEVHAIHRQEVIETPEKFGYTTRRRFQLGAFITAEQYISALRFRRQLHQDMKAAMRGYDLVMTANQWDRRTPSRSRSRSSTSSTSPRSPCRSTSPPARADRVLRLRQRWLSARLPACRSRLRRGERLCRRRGLRTRHDLAFAAAQTLIRRPSMKLTRRSLGRSFVGTSALAALPMPAFAQEKVVRFGISMADVPLTTGQPTAALAPTSSPGSRSTIR